MSEELNIILRWVTYWLRKTNRVSFENSEVRQLCYDILSDLLSHGKIDGFNMETGEVTLK